MVIKMDMNKWNEYENKRNDLHTKYRNKRILLFVVMLILIAVVSFVWTIFKEKLGSQLLFMGILFSDAVLLFIFLRKIREQKFFEKQQEALLREEEPIGKFKT